MSQIKLTYAQYQAKKAYAEFFGVSSRMVCHEVKRIQEEMQGTRML